MEGCFNDDRWVWRCCVVLIEDFNSVIDAMERRGVTHGVAHTSNSTREMLEFRQFLEELELVDFPSPVGNSLGSIPMGLR
jgi:hypothetical protein